MSSCVFVVVVVVLLGDDPTPRKGDHQTCFVFYVFVSFFLFFCYSSIFVFLGGGGSSVYLQVLLVSVSAYRHTMEGDDDDARCQLPVYFADAWDRAETV